MSSARLTFLYPYCFRGVVARLAESATQQPASIRYRRRPGPSCRRSIATSTRTSQAAFERHGTAVEPIPVVSDTAKAPQPDTNNSSVQPPNPPPKTAAAAAAAAVAAAESKEELSKGPVVVDAAPSNATKAGASDAKDAPPPDEKLPQSGPMEVVLQTPAPDKTQPPPAMHKATYVHHFDSYTLVKHLQAGGYTQEQAITVMKAVRAILAQNLDVAQDGLVWRSDVDNETYLFRAACSELNSEVTNNRRIANEQTRQQRTQLQHEFDILNQRMTQDIMTLKDDVKGMFNDRRMHVRDEQRNMESAIQQVNLKISATLNSDSRSDIEGLRWVLIRRSVLGILFMAIMTLSTIRYATYVTHLRQSEAKEKAHQAEEARRASGKGDRALVDSSEILAVD